MGESVRGGESGGGVYLSLGLYLLVTECVLHCLLVISKHCSLCAFLKQALGFKKQEPVPSLSLFVTAQYQELSPHRYYPAGAVTFFRSDVKWMITGFKLPFSKASVRGGESVWRVADTESLEVKRQNDLVALCLPSMLLCGLMCPVNDAVSPLHWPRFNPDLRLCLVG